MNWTTESIPDLTGKTIIITGANSGLGLEATRQLSLKGANVVMAVRNPDKGQRALQEIKAQYPKVRIDLMTLDLADLDSVHTFADEFQKKYSQLNVLINNAGVMFPPQRELSKQGFEIQFAVNHLGHFALTGLLLKRLKASSGSRVVSQSSMAHKMMGDIHFSDLHGEKNYQKMKYYAQSKLANLLFTYELDRQFKAHNIDAIATASHPGLSATNLFRSSGTLVGFFSSLIGRKASWGALPVLRAATEDSLSGSEFFGPNGWFEISGHPVLVNSTSKSHNTELARELWKVSEDLTGVNYDFAF
ncbi:MAG: short-chain dehydrogenase [Bacteroidetes bacterium HGW-Bacteroidetes-4]|jgi:NAD(P)-dependent dehydrogenase (short-subunit alcohol dehydrogenase family)|nr:MAG: short-chain dehydrogenase [Bacteroidetes bacterium HGW-Bacteroidetes-4]